MKCEEDRGRLLAGTVSGGSLLGLILLPKCPVCFAMWLGGLGVTGLLEGKMQSGLAGLLMMLAALSGWSLRSLFSDLYLACRSKL